MAALPGDSLVLDDALLGVRAKASLHFTISPADPPHPHPFSFFSDLFDLTFFGDVGG